MPASKQTSTGKLLEWQTDDSALIKNAVNAGYDEADLQIVNIPIKSFMAQNKIPPTPKQQRRDELPSMQDQLEAIWIGGSAQAAMKAAFSAIMDKYPDA